jgi:pimeloyl-[acyl-carrier protein] methyl ester esterase
LGLVLLGRAAGTYELSAILADPPAGTDVTAALVLIATTPRFLAGNGWAHGMRAALLGEFAQGLIADHARTVQNFLALQARGDERHSATLRMLRRQLATHGAPDLGALEAGLAILRDADLRDELPRIAQPTLVIAGEHDRLTPPEAGLELARAMPAARYRLIERSGHAPFLSHGPDVLSEVLGFLARHAVPGSVGVPA